MSRILLSHLMSDMSQNLKNVKVCSFSFRAKR